MTSKQAFQDVFSSAKALLLSPAGIQEHTRLYRLTIEYKRDIHQNGCRYASVAWMAITSDNNLDSPRNRLAILGVILWLFPSTSNALSGFLLKDMEQIQRVAVAVATYDSYLSQQIYFRTISENIQSPYAQIYSVEDAGNPLFKNARPAGAIVINAKNAKMTIEMILKKQAALKKYEELVPLVIIVAEHAKATRNIAMQISLHNAMLSQKDLTMLKQRWIEQRPLALIADEHQMTREKVRAILDKTAPTRVYIFIQKFAHLLDRAAPNKKE